MDSQTFITCNLDQWASMSSILKGKELKIISRIGYKSRYQSNIESSRQLKRMIQNKMNRKLYIFLKAILLINFLRSCQEKRCKFFLIKLLKTQKMFQNRKIILWNTSSLKLKLRENIKNQCFCLIRIYRISLLNLCLFIGIGNKKLNRKDYHLEKYRRDYLEY